MPDMDKKGVFDKKLGKYASRKLVVFFLTTIFFCLSMISADQWIYIAVAYVGTQAVIDTVERLKRIDHRGDSK